MPAPPIAILDWDDTLHRGITLLPWVDFLTGNSAFARDHTAPVHALFERAATGLLTYEQFAQQVVHEYARGLKGRTLNNVTNLALRFVARDQEHLFPFVRPMLALLNDHAITTILISGCPQEILDAYRPLLGFGQAYGVMLSRHDVTYSGDVDQNPALANAKEEIVSALSCEHSIALAIGNSISDWPLLKHAKLPLLLNSAVSLPMDGKIITGAHKVTESEVLPLIRQFLTDEALVQGS